ncbi:MAG: cytochrome c [Gallionella sp.]
MKNYFYSDGVIKNALILSIIASVLLFFSGVSYAANSDNGEKLYTVNCASCHGVKGAGIMFGMPNFGQGEGLLQTDRGILISIRYGKNSMPAYQGILSDTEILDVIAYLHTLY